MSYRQEKVLSLTGTEVSKLNRSELKNHSARLLEDKMHGICFSPYEGSQKPGDRMKEAKNQVTL